MTSGMGRSLFNNRSMLGIASILGIFLLFIKLQTIETNMRNLIIHDERQTNRQEQQGLAKSFHKNGGQKTFKTPSPTKSTSYIEKKIEGLLPPNFRAYNNCNSLYEDGRVKLNKWYTDLRPAMEAKIAELGGRGNATTEGGSWVLRTETLTFHEIARWKETATVCETGFNLGDSSYNYLTAGPDIHVYSFDLGAHPGTRPMAEYLQGIFKDRLTVTFGDSTQTIPRFHAAKPGVRCDFVLVDGGHSAEVARADINNFLQMSIPGKTVMILDDYPTTHLDIGIPWQESISQGHIKEIFKCNPNSNLHRGFGVAVVLKTL